MYLLLFVILCPLLTAQTLPGAHQAGISYSNTAYAGDVFSVFINPSLTAQIDWREAGVYYSPSPFGLKELATAGFAYNEPADIGAITAGFTTYGYGLLRENKFLISYSSGIADYLYLGLSGYYHSLSISNYGSAGAFCINFGTLAKVTDELSFGLSLLNLNNATYGSEAGQIPMVFSSGATYNYAETLLLHLSIRKETGYGFNFCGGFEYIILNTLLLRTGFSTESSSISAGAGLIFDLINFNYAVNSHPVLGLSHQLGVTISFKGEK